MLVLLTNVIDERNTERIRRHVLPTVGRHLPLVVCLRDGSLTDRIDAWERRDTADGSPAEQAAGTHAAAAAAAVLCWRRQVLADWQRAGVLTLDCLPGELTAKLVSEYLEIKARNRL